MELFQSWLGHRFDILMWYVILCNSWEIKFYIKIKKNLKKSLPGEPPPGTRQRCLVVVDEEALPGLLLPSWEGRWWTLPAPARKGGSCVTVLWVVEVGYPSRSKTEVLEAVFLDDVTFVLVLGSRCFWAKVTDEPAILSACLRYVHGFEGPLVWDPPHGFLQTVPSVQKKGLLQEGIATKQLQVRRGCKGCRNRRNLCFLNYGQLLPEKFRAFVLRREFFYYRYHHRVRKRGVNGGPPGQLFGV